MQTLSGGTVGGVTVGSPKWGLDGHGRARRSDPEDIESWAVSPRGAGWLFGSKVTAEVRVRPPLVPSSRGVAPTILLGARPRTRIDTMSGSPSPILTPNNTLL